MWDWLCPTGPFKFRWSRGFIYNTSYHHHQIRSINLFHHCHIFPWLYASEGCTIICCRFYIYIHISWDSCFFWFFLLLCSLMMCANNQVHYGLMVKLICLYITLPHYHHYAEVSEGIEPFILWWLWEYMYFILLPSSNRKYDPFAIV